MLLLVENAAQEFSFCYFLKFTEGKTINLRAFCRFCWTAGRTLPTAWRWSGPMASSPSLPGKRQVANLVGKMQVASLWEKGLVAELLGKMGHISLWLSDFYHISFLLFFACLCRCSCPLLGNPLRRRTQHAPDPNAQRHRTQGKGL